MNCEIRLMRGAEEGRVSILMFTACRKVFAMILVTKINGRECSKLNNKTLCVY